MSNWRETKIYDLISTPKTRNYSEWITWKKADLSGQTLVIGHPEGSSSAISGIRFVPEDGGKTVTWRGTNLIEATRQSNDIHEDSTLRMWQNTLNLFFNECNACA